LTVCRGVLLQQLQQRVDKVLALASFLIYRGLVAIFFTCINRSLFLCIFRCQVGCPKVYVHTCIHIHVQDRRYYGCPEKADLGSRQSRCFSPSLHAPNSESRHSELLGTVSHSDLIKITSLMRALGEILALPPNSHQVGTGGRMLFVSPGVVLVIPSMRMSTILLLMTFLSIPIKNYPVSLIYANRDLQ